MTFFEYQDYYDKQVDKGEKAELPKEMFEDWKAQHTMYNNLAKHIMDTTDFYSLKVEDINKTIDTVDNITRKALNITTMYLQLVNSVKKYNLELDYPPIEKQVQQMQKDIIELKKLKKS